MGIHRQCETRFSNLLRYTIFFLILISSFFLHNVSEIFVESEDLSEQSSSLSYLYDSSEDSPIKIKY